MPIKTSESSMYTPGKLIVASERLQTAGEVDFVEEGTVGLILEGPNPERSDQYRIQFLNGITWWVLGKEIEPHLNYF
jgi:hypothetical protein